MPRELPRGALRISRDDTLRRAAGHPRHVLGSRLGERGRE